MRKLAFTLILVLSISLLTLNAFGGDLEPSAPPGPTMHTLNEIYDQIVNNTVPRYEYKYFGSIDAGETVTIHNGSGVIHSIILGRSASGGLLILIDGSNNIFSFYDVSNIPTVIPLDIGYKNSLKLSFHGGILTHLDNITVAYKPDN